MKLLHKILGSEGDLSTLIPNFVVRPVQLDMAKAIATAIDDKSNGLFEAGTGTGKTFAYLIPVVLSGNKAIVSTGTKTLQDQLFFQDLPLIQQLMDRPFTVALLKGRANYVCPERLAKSIKVIDRNQSSQLLAQLVRVREWFSMTHSGDLTELSDFPEDSPILSMVTSNFDNCLAGQCPSLNECPLYKAREKAQQADLIVVNHHLLFADIALREDSASQLLPLVDTIIVDEAHQVPDVARQFFGARVGSGQLLELARDIRRELLTLGNDEVELLEQAQALEKSVQNMHQNLKMIMGLEPAFDFANWLANQGQEFVTDIDFALGGIQHCLQLVAQRSRGLEHCAQRAIRINDQFSLLTEPAEFNKDYVHWVDLHARNFVINLSPVSIAQELAVQFESQKWIFTSATLTVADSFSHIRESMGLIDAREKKFPSPFNYEQQVLAYVPDELPLPGTDEHTVDLLQSIQPLLIANSGKTMILFTSHRALKLAAGLLANIDDLTIYSQGQAPKAELLQRFRQGVEGVLLATQSFWEGVDLRGSGLNCLVIDKLPFASPDNPLARAMLNAIKLAGGNGFMDYLLPQAIISLRQGFGRLIRQESDLGLFILGDPRVMSRSYGKLVQRSLPEIEWTRSRETAQHRLQQIQMDNKA